MPVKNRKKRFHFWVLVSFPLKLYKCRNEKNIFQFDSFPLYSYNFFWKTKFGQVEQMVVIIKRDLLFILFFFYFKLNYEGRSIEVDRTLAILNRKRIAFDGGLTKFRLRDRISISRLLEDKGQSGRFLRRVAIKLKAICLKYSFKFVIKSLSINRFFFSPFIFPLIIIHKKKHKLYS